MKRSRNVRKRPCNSHRCRIPRMMIIFRRPGRRLHETCALCSKSAPALGQWEPWAPKYDDNSGNTTPVGIAGPFPDVPGALHRRFGSPQTILKPPSIDLRTDFENRLRSISGNYPMATFPWGRRQWAQPSRVCNFDQDFSHRGMWHLWKFNSSIRSPEET